MYILLFIIISAIIFVLLVQISWVLAMLFFILAIVTLPAAVIQRRDSLYETPAGPDAEHQGMGLIRLLGIVGLDTTGIALGVLLLLLGALIARALAFH